MSHEKAPEGGPDHAAESKEPTRAAEQSGEDWRKEIKDERRREALAYLVETGRARSPEDAERYLKSLNWLKVKLLFLARDLVAERESGDYYNDVDFPQVWSSQMRKHKPTPKEFAQRLREDINPTDPQIWDLVREVGLSYENFLPGRAHLLGTAGFVDRDQLVIGTGMLPPSRVVITPDWSERGEELGRELQRHLTKEEFEFLRQEYMHALGDLERQFRAITQAIESQRAEQKFPPSLETPAEKKEK